MVPKGPESLAEGVICHRHSFEQVQRGTRLFEPNDDDRHLLPGCRAGRAYARQAVDPGTSELADLAPQEPQPRPGMRRPTELRACPEG